MKKILPVVLAFVFILLIGAAVVWVLLAERNKESTEYLNYEEVMELSDGEYTVALDNDLQEFKAIELDGRVYVHVNDLMEHINNRFYWDENEQIFIYTKPTSVIKAYPDEAGYHVGEETIQLDYVAVKSVDNETYIALDYALQFFQSESEVYNSPNRVVIRTSWGAVDMVTTAEDTSIRYRGGVKSEILRDVTVGESLYLIESLNEWSHVATSDGYIGWIANKYISETSTVTVEAPAFEAEEFTNISRDFKINLTWHQVMTASANGELTTALENTSGINVLSPTWFSFGDTEGTLKSIASQEYVQTAHDRGIEVWALFSNEFPSDSSQVFDGTKTDQILAFTSKREQVVGQIINYALEYGLDGINLDFEEILAGGGDNYIQFVRELSVQCRINNIVLSVDNYVPTYAAHYDYEEQGVFVDYVIIMGYDENVESPGPVASIGFVEQGIKDTLAMVPNNKVINAIPFYTRVWLTGDGDVSSNFSAGMSEARGYLTDKGITPEFGEETGVNYGEYVSEIDGNYYQIWLEDADSVTAKMKLIQQYELAGVASWKLGLESGIEIWDIINSFLQ